MFNKLLLYNARGHSDALKARRGGGAAKELELRRNKKAQKTGAERVQGSKAKALTS